MGFRRQLLNRRDPISSLHNVFLFYSHFQQNRISTAHMVLYKDLKGSLETFTDERTHINLPLTVTKRHLLFLTANVFKRYFRFISRTVFPYNVLRRPGFPRVIAALTARCFTPLFNLKREREFSFHVDSYFFLLYKLFTVTMEFSIC